MRTRHREEAQEPQKWPASCKGEKAPLQKRSKQGCSPRCAGHRVWSMEAVPRHGRESHNTGRTPGDKPGADQETDGGHSDGNKPALFEHPGSLRKITSVRTLLGWYQTQYPTAMSKPWKNSGYKKIKHFNDIWGGFKMNLALASIKSFQVFLDGPVGE